jgi:hypothetical protein
MYFTSIYHCAQFIIRNIMKRLSVLFGKTSWIVRQVRQTAVYLYYLNNLYFSLDTTDDYLIFNYLCA